MVEAAPGDEAGTKELNYLMLELLRESYWAGAILRRLLDPGPLYGPKGVRLLRAFIADMRACRCRITRRVYVEDIAGLEYDHEDIEQHVVGSISG